MTKPKLFGFIVLSLLLVHNVWAETRTALVIGNSAYKISPLKNPVNDAKDMAEILEERGFDVILITDVPQRKMKTAIRSFGKKLSHKGGIGLFYYAGHALQVEGRNYLLPLGAQIDSQSEVEFEAVDAGRILGQMEAAGNDINIVILDACRNNPYARSFRSSSRGLVRMEAPTGSLIAYATAPGSVAADGEGRNGIYTKYLIRNIRKPGLKIEEILKNVRVAVLKDTGNRQTPWESSSLTGDFYFHLPKRTEMVPPVSEAVPVPAATQRIIHSGPAKLYVKTKPANTRIRILNIIPKFHQGIELEPGQYHVEVSHHLYKTVKVWETLDAGDNKTLEIKLDQLKAGGESSGAPVNRELRYAESLIERGKKSEAKRIVTKILNTSKDDNTIAETMFYQILWGFSSDDNEAFEKFKAYYPDNQYVSSIESVLNEREFALQRPGVEQGKKDIEEQKRSKTKYGRIAERDGRYVKYESGIIYDKNTGLEWVAGPDKTTNWHKANQWVKKLSIAGGEWRMPKIKELTSLYENKQELYNMLPGLKISGWYVWSGEKVPGESAAKGFDFSHGQAFSYDFWATDTSGDTTWYDGSGSTILRAFAVRSRR